MTHILLFVLSGVFAYFEILGDKDGAPLTTHSFGRVEVAEVVKPTGAEPGLPGEFPASEFEWVAVFPVG